MQTEQTETQIVEYSVTQAALAILTKRYANTTYDVATSAGMAMARAARADIKQYRTGLEKKRVELKAPALERSRLIDAEAKRITAELVKLEEPIDQIIKAEEARKEQEKAEKAEADRNRIAAIIGLIEKIKATPKGDMTAAEISDEISKVDTFEISADEFQEFAPMAEEAKVEARDRLSALYSQKLTQEENAARVAAEQKAEQERQEAERVERDRLAQIEAAKLAEQQEQLRIEREAFEAEKAAADRVAAEAKAVQDAADEVIRLQKQADDKKAQEEAQAAAVEAEKKRVEAELRQKAAEKARKLAEAKCADSATAFKKILALCQDNSLQDYEALVQIAIIAEGNI